MVREPSEELVEVAREFVSVRVTDMSRVDLEVYRFDYDLTFAALLMSGDGTVYHRFGGRDAGDPLEWNTMPVLAELMRETLEEHEAAAREAPAERTPRFVVDLAPLKRKRVADPKLAASCVHCHTVHETLHALAVEEGTFEPDDVFVHPPPGRIGVTLDPDDQAMVIAVAEDSPAAATGIEAGDRLLRVGVQPRVLTIADLSWALHEADAGATEVPVTWERDGDERAATLRLDDGWKRSPPEEYAWRPYKWNLSPAPGFGGPELTADEKAALDLPAEGFAFRVNYLVTWGPRAHRGRAARAAGVRKGDVVVAFAGKSDFESVAHFHAWVRLTRRVGEEVVIEVLRDGRRRTLRYVLPE